MGLIDVVSLKKNLFDYAPPEMTWDRDDIEHKIDEMPIIEAIPVEWLRNYDKAFDGMIPVGRAIKDWHYEKENGVI